MSEIILGVDRISDSNPLIDPTILARQIIDLLHHTDILRALLIRQASLDLGGGHIRPAHPGAMSRFGTLHQRLHPQHAATPIADDGFTAALERQGDRIGTHGASRRVAGYKPDTHNASPVA